MPQSHVHPPPDAEVQPDTGLVGNSQYREGLRRFNAGEFFECHEILEALWKPARGEDRLLLQGLIQLAVAVLKWQRGNRRGAVFLYRRALLKWHGLAALSGGLDLVALRAQTAVLFAPLEAAATAAPLPPLDPATLPVLRIHGGHP